MDAQPPAEILDQSLAAASEGEAGDRGIASQVLDRLEVRLKFAAFAVCSADADLHLHLLRHTVFALRGSARCMLDLQR